MEEAAAIKFCLRPITWKNVYVKYKRDIKLYIQNNNYVNTPKFYTQKCLEEHLTPKD